MAQVVLRVAVCERTREDVAYGDHCRNCRGAVLGIVAVLQGVEDGREREMKFFAGLLWGSLLSVLLALGLALLIMWTCGCATERDTGQRWPWPDWRRLEPAVTNSITQEVQK